MDERFRIPGNRLEPGVARSVWWCGGCRFGRLHPVPTPAESLSFHSAEYFARFGKGKGRERGWSRLDRLRAAIAWRLDRSRPTLADVVPEYVGRGLARVCDVGCGNGDLLARIRAAGHEVVGVEPSEHARRNATEKGLPVLAGTAEDLPPGLTGGFDLVISVHVIEHCPDPVRALGNMVALARPGGLVACETPNFDCFGFALRGPAWKHADIPRHVSFFTADSLAAAMKKFGCEIRSVEYRGFTNQFLEFWTRTEQEVWDAMYSGRPGVEGAPERPSTAGVWMRLFSMIGTPARRKYDGVRVVARVGGSG